MNNQENLDKSLIGIEWEPQFTLPNYSGYQVLFENNFVLSNDNKQLVTNIRKQVDGVKVSISAKHEPFYSPKRVIIQINEEQFKNFINKISKEISKLLCLDDKKDTKKLFTDELIGLVGIDGTNMEFRTIASSLKQLPNSIAISDSLLFLFIEKLNKYVSGGVGVFLPKTTSFEIPKYVINNEPSLQTQLHFIPTKHVNITFKDMPIHENYWSYDEPLLYAKFFGTKIGLKSRKIGYPKRLHITVPYNFTDYENLIKAAYPIYQKLYGASKSNADVTDHYNDIIKYLDSWAKNNPMNSPILLKYVKQKRLVTCRSLL